MRHYAEVLADCGAFDGLGFAAAGACLAGCRVEMGLHEGDSVVSPRKLTLALESTTQNSKFVFV